MLSYWSIHEEQPPKTLKDNQRPYLLKQKPIMPSLRLITSYLTLTKNEKNLNLHRLFNNLPLTNKTNHNKPHYNILFSKQLLQFDK